MAMEINGVAFTYPYDERGSGLLTALKRLLDDGLVEDHTVINLVRDDKERQLSGTKTYRPIVDYYLPNFFEAYSTPIEKIYIRDEYTDDEWEKLREFHKEMVRIYKEDEPKFEQATVLGAITEMEQWNSLPDDVN